LRHGDNFDLRAVGERLGAGTGLAEEVRKDLGSRVRTP
jgi:hypothetical protein